MIASGWSILFLEAVVASVEVTVKTEYGPVTGSQRGGVREFLGVPFAAPPVGSLRWREPQSPEAWAQPLVADAAFRCFQIGCQGPEDVCGSEHHCLEASVWVPAGAAVAPKAVLVWIYGGANFVMYPDAPVFNGTKLVQHSVHNAKPVIVAAIGYRLAGLGFMAMPELTAESPHRTSGNYGFLDQVFGLQWIKRNIQAFGAAPGARVTVFGESAGAWDISAHIASPLSRGLFEGAVIESTYTAYEFYNHSMAERVGSYAGQQCLADYPHFQDPLACLRSLPDWKVSSPPMPPGFSGLGFAGLPLPNVDGYALLCPPLTALQSTSDECGELPQVATMIGASMYEGSPGGSLDRQNLGDKVWDRYIKLADMYSQPAPAASEKKRVVADAERAYPVDDDLRARLTEYSEFYQQNWTADDLDGLRWVDMTSPELCSGYFTAKFLAERGTTPAYLYLFTHTPSQEHLKLLRATHTSEIPFVFGTFSEYGLNPPAMPPTTPGKPSVIQPGWKKVDWAPTSEEIALSSTIMDHWLTFAHTGAPKSDWHAATVSGGALAGWYNFSISPLAVTDAPYWHAEQCEFWMSAASPRVTDVVLV